MTVHETAVGGGASKLNARVQTLLLTAFLRAEQMPGGSLKLNRGDGAKPLRAGLI